MEPPTLSSRAATAVVNQAGFLFAESNVRYLTRAELEKLFADQLHIARNEIFARRGRYFNDLRLSAHFANFAWYQPYAWHVRLNLIEQANVGLIRSLEAPPSTRSTISRRPPT
jgi:YARHG domain